jgi:hypothetical protein
VSTWIPKSEIGRELRVSELQPETIVVLEKPDVAAATMWVREVLPGHVVFWAGMVSTTFLARRCGKELERISDDSGATMNLYEYLGVK